jgi:SAM-dependent methyltransferase
MTQPKQAAPPRANAAQQEFWSTDGQLQYRQHEDRFEEMFRPFGRAIFECAEPQPGERVLDIGCGYATTTIEAARQVGPSGSVVGVDISSEMFAVARQRLADARVDNVALVEADAQVAAFDAASFDLVISRFGTMFFDDPAAAFANLAQALRPGGRLAFTCWREPHLTEWAAVAVGVAVKLLGRPPQLGPAGGPGPFALADGDRVRSLVDGAGFTDVSLESITRPQRVGTDAPDVAAYVMSLPESKHLFAGEPAAVLADASRALEVAFAPYAGAHGVVMDATAWLVSARRS